jgi:hypothetical protein
VTLASVVHTTRTQLGGSGPRPADCRCPRTSLGFRACALPRRRSSTTGSHGGRSAGASAPRSSRAVEGETISTTRVGGPVDGPRGRERRPCRFKIDDVGLDYRGVAENEYLVKNGACSGLSAPHDCRPLRFTDRRRQLLIPPSTTNVWPVMNPASSLRRKFTRGITSATVANRPNGVRLTICRRCCSPKEADSAVSR